MTVKMVMMMLMMGEPDPRIVMLGSGSPTSLIVMVVTVKMMMMGEPDPRIIMLGSGSPASLTVMVMMVIMKIMGKPDPRMSHVGVGFPRRLYKKIFFSYCDRGGGTRPQHDFGRATAFYCVPNYCPMSLLL